MSEKLRRRALPWRDALCEHYRRPEDFLPHVYQDPNSGCWLWLGSTDHKDYGMVQCCRRRIRVPRLVILLRGEVLQGFLALHKCDTPLCINPDHVYAGTTSQNARDAVSRGRWPRKGNKLPPGITAFRSSTHPFRAIRWNGTKNVHVGYYETVEQAKGALADLLEGKP